MLDYELECCAAVVDTFETIICDGINCVWNRMLNIMWYLPAWGPVLLEAILHGLWALAISFV